MQRESGKPPGSEVEKWNVAFENYLKKDQDFERALQVKGFIEFLKKKIEGK